MRRRLTSLSSRRPNPLQTGQVSHSITMVMTEAANDPRAWDLPFAVLYEPDPYIDEIEQADLVFGGRLVSRIDDLHSERDRCRDRSDEQGNEDQTQDDPATCSSQRRPPFRVGQSPSLVAVPVVVVTDRQETAEE